MWTFVTQSRELPVFFDQQSSAAAQVNLSHPVTMQHKNTSCVCVCVLGWYTKTNLMKNANQNSRESLGKQLHLQPNLIFAGKSIFHVILW